MHQCYCIVSKCAPFLATSTKCSHNYYYYSQLLYSPYLSSSNTSENISLHTHAITGSDIPLCEARQRVAGDTHDLQRPIGSLHCQHHPITVSCPVATKQRGAERLPNTQRRTTLATYHYARGLNWLRLQFRRNDWYIPCFFRRSSY
jgi:hypothetical protein